MHSREEAWELLARPLDVLVIGGGITGAGVLMEASRRGLRAALVERGDFAGGTSSRSSKLVHGGLRYLRQGNLRLTREAVHERETLLREAPGLVEPMPFIMPQYKGSKPGRIAVQLALSLYDALAGHKRHGYLNAQRTLEQEPAIARDGLLGAHTFYDATTDDARLVMRLLSEAERAGGASLNYAESLAIEREGGRVTAAIVRDLIGDRQQRVHARAIVNATGVFAGVRNMRPLRGSHLVLERERLPLRHAVAFAHPADRRPVFAYPWLGVTLVGTTDLDHRGDLRAEPAISSEELRYLLDALAAQFPQARISRSDVVSTFAGLRPVIGTGAKPSSESRDCVLIEEQGVTTTTGGKLTTFRPMALHALRAACKRAKLQIDMRAQAIFAPAHSTASARLNGRYGPFAPEVLEYAHAGDLESVPGTDTTWAELRYALHAECVVHLDDLLLRRTRLGLQLRNGGEEIFPRVQALCADELGWDDAAWRREAGAYSERIRRNYGVPA